MPPKVKLNNQTINITKLTAADEVDPYKFLNKLLGLDGKVLKAGSPSVDFGNLDVVYKELAKQREHFNKQLADAQAANDPSKIKAAKEGLDNISAHYRAMDFAKKILGNPEMKKKFDGGELEVVQTTTPGGKPKTFTTNLSQTELLEKTKKFTDRYEKAHPETQGKFSQQAMSGPPPFIRLTFPDEKSMNAYIAAMGNDIKLVNSSVPSMAAPASTHLPAPVAAANPSAAASTAGGAAMSPPPSTTPPVAPVKPGSTAS